jgi:hypothetical protein
MDQRFAKLVETLAPKLEHLRAMQPLHYGALPAKMSKSGIYLFTESGKHLYVGRSNRRRHSRFSLRVKSPDGPRLPIEPVKAAAPA